MRKKVLASLSIAAAMVATTMPAMAATAETPHEFTEHADDVNTPDEVCMEQTVSSEDENKSAQCDVYAKVGSQFTVTIPKKITLDGVSKTGTYTVSCKGDIAGNEYVSVTPAASFDMIQTGKDNVTATITQGNLNFRGYNYTNGVDASLPANSVKMGNTDGSVESQKLDGSIDAQDLTAGAWTGNFNFTIALNTDPAGN